VPQTDTRLVQTAVIGGRSSDRPVILPEEPHNLDEFRRQYGTDVFWCGTLLGGCGQKLMTKRYETKVCHFSHYPDRMGTAEPCHRAAKGVDSADHLFIKQHVKDWLAGQGQAAQAELRSLGTGPGDAVDFWLRATGQHLRFELRPEDYLQWRKAAESLGAREGHVEWVFGPDNAITRDMVARQGYALRARCETSGNDRQVLIGTLTADAPVIWAPLDTCRMTPDGMVTPTLNELRAAGKIRIGGMRNEPLPASLPLRGAELFFAVDVEAAAPADSPLTAEGRRLYAGYVKPAGSRIIRTLLSLPDDVPPPAEDYVYQLSGAARLLITDPIGEAKTSWSLRVDGIVRLNGLAAERTGMWRPSVAMDATIATPHPQIETRQHAPVRDKPVVQPVRGRHAAALRKELERVAALGTTTTWRELAGVLGAGMANQSDQAARSLLVEADQPVPPDGAPLCVLVLAPGGRRPLPYLKTTLRTLGVDAPASDAALQRWSTDAIRRVHAAYGRRGPKGAEASRIARTAPAIPPSPSELGGADRHMRALRSKVQEATHTLSRATGRRAERLASVIDRAEGHIQRSMEVRTEGRVLRRWRNDGAILLEELSDLVGRIPDTPAATTPQTSSAIRSSVKVSADESSPDTPSVPSAKNSSTATVKRGVPQIADLFAEAQASGDFVGAVQLKREAVALFEAGLVGQELQRLRTLKNEMRKWIKDREAGEAQQSLRTVFESLPAPGDPEEAGKLSDALAQARILKRRCPGSLPQDLSDEFDALQMRTADGSAASKSQSQEHFLTSGPAKRSSADIAETQAELDWLVEEIRAAQQADDFASVEAARQLAAPLYASGLPPEDRAGYTPFMQEVQAWCEARSTRPGKDPALKQIRRLLSGLDTTGPTLTAADIRLVLDTIREIRPALTSALPAVEETRLVRWKNRMNHLQLTKQDHASTAQVPSPAVMRGLNITMEKRSSVAPGRLPPDAIERLAVLIRAVLEDTARAGGDVLTWGALRARMKDPLPHLHPDDQGELLVAVDRDTPHEDPLLTTLIASAETSQHWLYPHVRYSLGRPRVPEEELEAHWVREVLRLRQSWRYR
jgi:hypothetical protein